MSECDIASGPRPVEEEITELFAGMQLVATLVSRRTDIDLIEQGYPLGDGWQPMFDFEEEE